MKFINEGTKLGEECGRIQGIVEGFLDYFTPLYLITLKPHLGGIESK